MKYGIPMVLILMPVIMFGIMYLMLRPGSSVPALKLKWSRFSGHQNVC